MNEQLPIDRKPNPEICDCEFTPYTDEDADEESWHYLRECQNCNHQWYGLHCPHDGYQNACPKCDTRPTPVPEREAV